MYSYIIYPHLCSVIIRAYCIHWRIWNFLSEGTTFQKTRYKGYKLKVRGERTGWRKEREGGTKSGRKTDKEGWRKCEREGEKKGRKRLR